MSAQISLLATLADEQTPASPPSTRASRDVLALGARAPDVRRHSTLHPPEGVTRQVWSRMLDFTEGLLRDATPTTAAIDASDRDAVALVASSGTIAAADGFVWFDVERQHLVERHHGHRIPWTQLLATLAALREDEPQVARARDLAQAHRLRAHYGQAYVDAPARLLDRLDAQITALGGDPTHATPRSTDR